MWWILFLTAVLMLIIYFMFAPFFVEIDSTRNLLRVRFHRLVTAGFILNERSIYLELKTAGWKKRMDLLSIKRKEKKIVVQAKKKKQKKISIQKVFAVIKSFRVRKFDLDLDTGNVQANGMLYPLFTWLKIRSGKNISINFADENKLILQIENNFARILWAYIKS